MSPLPQKRSSPSSVGEARSDEGNRVVGALTGLLRCRAVVSGGVAGDTLGRGRAAAQSATLAFVRCCSRGRSLASGGVTGDVRARCRSRDRALAWDSAKASVRASLSLTTGGVPSAGPSHVSRDGEYARARRESGGNRGRVPFDDGSQGALRRDVGVAVRARGVPPPCGCGVRPRRYRGVLLVL